MPSRPRPRLSYANVVATLALIIALAAGGPAVAKPVANAAANLTSVAKKALRIAKSADRRSKRAIASPGPAGEKGARGEKGDKGDPGPATGPAGGALIGNYPDPQLAAGSVGTDQLAPEAVGSGAIAPKAVTGDHVAGDSLRGEQIVETSLQGFDRSVEGKATSGGAPITSTATVGNQLKLVGRCTTGAPGNYGFEFAIKNEAGSTRTAYMKAIAEGHLPRVSKISVASGDELTLFDVPDSTTGETGYWITVLVPGLDYETVETFARTRIGGGSVCEVRHFRTIRSG